MAAARPQPRLPQRGTSERSQGRLVERTLQRARTRADNWRGDCLATGMGVHAAKRLPGFSYVGACEYSVTCCTFKRQRLFIKTAIVDAVCTQLLKIAVRQRFEIPAYCFMPDHVHVLATATADDSDLRQFVARWKQQTGYSHRQRENTTLWQGGFYEHVLRAEEDRAAVIRYLLENPLRAGLVQNVGQYPYWGSGLCSREELIETLYDAPVLVRS